MSGPGPLLHRQAAYVRIKLQHCVYLLLSIIHHEVRPQERSFPWDLAKRCNVELGRQGHGFHNRKSVCHNAADTSYVLLSIQMRSDQIYCDEPSITPAT